ncbi:MAG: citrate lyase acyl carrier protein [Candidatus Krumholzibacteriota bacterium]|nr:citrate lyase acyl carrier protein [Candidatus Krumholzibacteriota bacterium]
MNRIMKTLTGREGKKNDLLVKMEAKKSGSVSVSIESKVMSMYGDQIEATVRETLKTLGVKHCRVEVSDNGAFDYVIQARVEAAARRLYDIEEPGCLPERKVPRRKPGKERLRRTRLYMPGNNPSLMYNGGIFGADCVILDLEDSVAPAQKDAARILVRNTLLSVDFGEAEKIVRINPLSSRYGRCDIETVLPAGPDTILIPKSENARDIRDVEEITGEIEQREGLKNKTFLMPLIETAAGVLSAREIAEASGRVVALCFGAEDFTADMGVSRTRSGKESFVARSLLVIGARAAGVQAIDTVFSDIKDTEGLIESAREAKDLGFAGKGVIHPSQIEPVHDVFAPGIEEIEYARKVVSAIDEAREKGSGVATIGRKMIDAPIEKRARKVLSIAETLGLIDKTG